MEEQAEVERRIAEEKNSSRIEQADEDRVESDDDEDDPSLSPKPDTEGPNRDVVTGDSAARTPP